jgi:hypothetical protein
MGGDKNKCELHYVFIRADGATRNVSLSRSSIKIRLLLANKTIYDRFVKLLPYANMNGRTNKLRFALRGCNTTPREIRVDYDDAGGGSQSHQVRCQYIILAPRPLMGRSITPATLGLNEISTYISIVVCIGYFTEHCSHCIFCRKCAPSQNRLSITRSINFVQMTPDVLDYVNRFQNRQLIYARYI